MKKVLSVVLALVMMLSAVSVAFAAATDSDTTMNINETRAISFPGVAYSGYYVVRFVAPGNGKVALYPSDLPLTLCHPVLEVYQDSLNGKKLCESEGTSLKREFYYELDCVAGTTYFFALSDTYDKDWDFTIECLHETYVDGKCVTCNQACPHVKGDNIVGCCPCGESFDGLDVEVGDRIKLESDKDRVWFRFTPDETAPYILKSENPGDPEAFLPQPADPAFIIVNYSGEVVLANDADISADDKNFNFPFLFVEGERYFIGVSADSSFADDWYFTFASGTKHTTFVEEIKIEPVMVEKMEQKVDENGEPVFENGEPVMQVVKDENGNPVMVQKMEQKVDENGEPVFENGEPVMVGVTKEVPVQVPVEHNLAYEALKNPTCQEAGHTPRVYCNDCNETIAGGDEIAKVACKDDNGDYKCDYDGCTTQFERPEEPDPTKDCKCNCHKDGISNFFFRFILFFQKIFRLNSVCKCGVVRHY